MIRNRGNHEIGFDGHDGVGSPAVGPDGARAVSKGGHNVCAISRTSDHPRKLANRPQNNGSAGVKTCDASGV